MVMGYGDLTHCAESVLVIRLLSGKRQMLHPHVVHISCSRSHIVSQHCVLHQLLQTRTTASTHEAKIDRLFKKSKYEMECDLNMTHQTIEKSPRVVPYLTHHFHDSGVFQMNHRLHQY